MKRFLVTILALLYMAGATGATVHIHYCMNELVGVSLTHDHDDRCERCGMKEDKKRKGCCKDEQKTFKTSTHHLAKAVFDVQQQFVAIVPTTYFQHRTATIYHAPVNELAQAHAPPSYWGSCPIYIQVCNFRI